MSAQNVNIRGNPTVISLFAGCGGSSLGYQLAGYKELLAIDFDKNSVDTFKLNFPDTPIWFKDITKVSGNDILTFTKLKKGELDILDASVPCQGFSTAGSRNVKDKRNDLFKEFVRLIKDLNPKVFIMENVYGMATGVMKGKFIQIIKTLKRLNYKVKIKLLNSANYSVPQARPRLFFIGVRKDLNKEPVFPKRHNKIITVREAFKGVNNKGEKIIKPTGTLIINSKNIKQGERLCDTLGTTSGFSIRRLDWDKPSWTVLKTFQSGISGLLHPSKDRFLTIAELKRVSSFPDNFKLTGTFTEQWARIGNAVMPLQMKAIAETIRKEILLK